MANPSEVEEVLVEILIHSDGPTDEIAANQPVPAGTLVKIVVPQPIEYVVNFCDGTHFERAGGKLLPVCYDPGEKRLFRSKC